MLSERDYRRRMFETVLTVAGIAVLLAVLWAAREALMLVYVSALIAMGFAPLVQVIEQPRPTARRRVPRWLAILVIYFAIVGALVLVGLMVIPPLVAQAESLWTKLPEYFNAFQGFLIKYKLMTHRVTLEEAVQNAPTGTGGNAVGTVLVAISSLIGGVFGLITILILSFYLLIEAHAMFEYFLRFVPAARRGDITIAAREAVAKVSAWLRAQFVLAAVMGTFAAIGLGLMGVPYFYVIALVAAIGETIPIVGPVIGGITAVAVAITVSPKLALMVGVYFLVLHQLEANILVPKIMERRVGVSPVAVMVALLVGGALWGLVGAILAIPTAAILSVVVEELAADHAVRIQRESRSPTRNESRIPNPESRIPNPESRIPNPESRIPILTAALIYAAVTLALTWPLARGLTRDVAGDFGDPLFTSWAIAWDATHLGRGWWHANIFAPHPLALAYSEHFLPQALQVLPIYAATKNPILCYNLLFLSTFVLSGLGMFLFVRELTGSPPAGLVAGLAFAFTPYRIASIPHLQVLSSAWMPFVLYGLRRHFDTRRTAPLAAAAVAWVLQNLSCGYYLLFFSPVVLFYIAWELTVRGLWRDRRELLRVVAACAIVSLATLPFLLPYLELRHLGFSPRSLSETRRFSADVYAYFTADPNLRLWGPFLQAWPHAEGLLFPGLTIVLLAVIGACANVGRPFQGRFQGRLAGDPKRVALRLSVASSVCIVITLLLGYAIRLPGVKITSLSRVAIVGAAAAAMVLAVSRAARAGLAAWLRSPAAWLVLVAVFAIAMSFGPDIHAKGRSVAGANVYTFFYNHVPGFDGLRVPARYAMIAALALAALAGLGVAAIEPRSGRHPAARSTRAPSLGAYAPVIAGSLIVLEAIAVPIPLNQSSTDYKDAALAPLPASIAIGSALPPVYRFVAQLPSSAVLLELPLGEPAFDIRYMFYSTSHWKRLVNGYSGGAPIEYEFLTESLKDGMSRPARAWQALLDSTATHIVVHEAFYKGDRGEQLSAWLRTQGARELAAFGSERVFGMP